MEPAKWVNPGPNTARVIETAEGCVREVCRLYLRDMSQAAKPIESGLAAHHLMGAASLAQLQGYPTMAEAFRQAGFWIAQQPNAMAALTNVAFGG